MAGASSWFGFSTAKWIVAVDRIGKTDDLDLDPGDRLPPLVHDRAFDPMGQGQELHDDRVVLRPGRPVLVQVTHGSPGQGFPVAPGEEDSPVADDVAGDDRAAVGVGREGALRMVPCVDFDRDPRRAGPRRIDHADVDRPGVGLPGSLGDLRFRIVIPSDDRHPDQGRRRQSGQHEHRQGRQYSGHDLSPDLGPRQCRDRAGDGWSSGHPGRRPRDGCHELRRHGRRGRPRSAPCRCRSGRRPSESPRRSRRRRSRSRPRASRLWTVPTGQWSSPAACS